MSFNLLCARWGSQSQNFMQSQISSSADIIGESRNFTCRRHCNQEISYFCVSPSCNNKSRLLCDHCVLDHNGELHEVISSRDFENYICKEQENQTAQKIQKLFTDWKGRIQTNLDKVQEGIFKQFKLERSVYDFDILKQQYRPQGQLSHEQMEKFVEKALRLKQTLKEEGKKFTEQSLKVLTEYVNKFNSWLTTAPELNIEEINLSLLKERHIAFGSQVMFKFNNERALVTSMIVHENLRLKRVVLGDVQYERLQTASLILSIYKGTQINSGSAIFEQQINLIPARPGKLSLDLDYHVPLWQKGLYTFTLTTEGKENVSIGDYRLSPHLNAYLQYQNYQNEMSIYESNIYNVRENLKVTPFIVDCLVLVFKNGSAQ